MNGLPSRGGERHDTRVVALAAACALAGVLALGFATTHQSTPPPAPAAAGTPRPADAPPSRPPGPPPTPTGLDIPDIGVHTALDALTTDRDGVLQPPDRPDRAGWYTTAPAWQNPLVITGHVDYPASAPPSSTAWANSTPASGSPSPPPTGTPAPTPSTPSAPTPRTTSPPSRSTAPPAPPNCA
nr:class F sortase [Kitasatospora fiedleri]